MVPPRLAGFPFTSPTIVGGFNSFTGISNDLKAPYQYLLNFSIARPLPKRMSIEVGYVGRLSHGVLLTQDYGQPLTQFRDPKSGQTWAQASGILRDVLESCDARPSEGLRNRFHWSHSWRISSPGQNVLTPAARRTTGTPSTTSMPAAI